MQSLLNLPEQLFLFWRALTSVHLLTLRWRQGGCSLSYMLSGRPDIIYSNQNTAGA